MQFYVLTLAAAASATALTLHERDFSLNYPIVQVLPITGYNATDATFNSLGSYFLSSAAQLSSQVNGIAQANAGAGGSVYYNYDVQANLARTLSGVSNTFWQTAYDTEKKICSIATSISKQNVDSVKGNLRAGIIAEAQAVASLTATLADTISSVQSQINTFTDAEKAVLTALIQAIAASVIASVGPVAALSAGLSATGVTALNDVVQTLMSAAASLQAVASVNWSY